MSYLSVRSVVYIDFILHILYNICRIKNTYGAYVCIHTYTCAQTECINYRHKMNCLVTCLRRFPVTSSLCRAMSSVHSPLTSLSEEETMMKNAGSYVSRRLGQY